MKKSAKLHVQEVQEAQAARLAQQEGLDSERREPQIKKKSSPRTLDKVKFHTRKKMREFKRDIILNDDATAMRMLGEALRTQRGEGESLYHHKPQVKAPVSQHRPSGHLEHRSLRSARGSIGSFETMIEQTTHLVTDTK
jgi:hypothetical protein